MAWKRFFLGVILVCSVIGGYSSIKAMEVKATGEAHGVCTALSGFDCVAVQKSSYSEFLGVPVALMGLAAYIFFFLVVFVYANRPTESLLNVMTFGAAFGLLFSLYLTSIEAFVLHAWCLYCVMSQISIFLIFIAILGLRWAWSQSSANIKDIHQ